MSPAETNALWRSLTKLYPAWSLPIDLFLSPTTWQLLGTNLMPSIVKDKRARRASAVLAAAGPAATPIMLDISRINATRAADIFRSVALGYVSVPIAISALISDAAPGFVSDQLRNNIGDVIYWVIVLAVTPMIYFCMMWRAKQLQWAIEAHQTGAIEPLPSGKHA
jgi:hypothetical protein